MDAALALDGLHDDRRGLGADGLLQCTEVVAVDERDARDERLERGPLRGLPGDGKRAEGAAVERALERHEAALAGRLARVLERRLVRLGPRVAEEGGRAAEPVGEPRRERLHRLGPVEVRDVPERVELRVRGRERCGVEVAEADDGDACDQVEVARAVVGGDPAPLAAHERDVGARVRRQHGRARQRAAHATTAVWPISAWTPSRAAVTAARSFGWIPPWSVPPSSSSSASSAAMRETTAPASSRPGTSVRKRMRSAPRPIASAEAASSALTFSGPAASGATTGTRPASSAASTAAGADGTGSPTSPRPGARVASRPIS